MKERLAKIYEQIAKACPKSGRDPKDVILIGVTKYTDLAKVQQALDAGLTNIAENRVQDAQERFPALKMAPGQVTKHLIGHLQSNKAKFAVPLFDMIQSVDSFKLAEEIQKQAEKNNKNIDILIQVNCSNEEQKSGVDKAQALELIDQVSGLKNVTFKGLMTMAALTTDEKAVREAFSSLRNLSGEAKNLLAKKSHGEMKYLSMGMSQDFGIAIEEGSNMVRVGRAIFGE
ncbi:MAG: YggS family pyridoxal phosphate-dependent enzyme [Candidatus Omnitrophica bacterium]|nr:YggS family pyridoxal phosphate-dependent enzyme [Candidatus Omnitrophota bacterium]